MAEGKEAGNGKTTVITAAFDAKAWSVEEPNLYSFNAVITYDDGSVEDITDSFGFRYFETDEKYIYLNGFPFYMRVYIICFGYAVPIKTLKLNLESLGRHPRKFRI